MSSKYQRWYDQIITRAKSRRIDEYSERHHILPRSLGGGDEENNLVTLTYREHFLAHWLLVKIYDGEARRPMVMALHCMTWSLWGRLVAGWQVEIAKRAIRDECKKSALARREKWKRARKIALAEEWGRFETAKSLARNYDPAIGKDRNELRNLATLLVGNRARKIKRVYDPNNPNVLFEKLKNTRPSVPSKFKVKDPRERSLEADAQIIKRGIS